MTDIEILEALNTELKKALTASTTSKLVSRQPPTSRPDNSNIRVIGARGRSNLNDPYIIPTAIIEVIPEFSKSEATYTCESCGLINKSQNCRKCSHSANINESKPFHLK